MRIYTEGPLCDARCSCFVRQIFAFYYQEAKQPANTATACLQLMVVTGLSQLRNAICTRAETSKIPTEVACIDHYSVALKLVFLIFFICYFDRFGSLVQHFSSCCII